MATQVTKWESTDGKLFDTEELANLYETQGTIIQAMRNKPFPADSKTNPKNILGWLNSIPEILVTYVDVPKP